MSTLSQPVFKVVCLGPGMWHSKGPQGYNQLCFEGHIVLWTELELLGQAKFVTMTFELLLWPC